ncbi:sensor histidine kinase [Elusimicrobiota bacterium]
MRRDLDKRTKDLREREKELRCIYEIAKIRDKNASLPETIQMIVNVMPVAWLYPQVACVRVMFDGREFTSKNPGRRCDRRRSDILVHDENKGFVEIAYTKKMPRRDEGPFLAAERNLLDSIAKRIGKIAERAAVEKQLKNANRRFRELFGHVESVKDEERARIASELHDDLGQILTSLKVVAGKLKRSERRGDEPFHAKVNLICELVDSSLNSVHGIVSKLRPPLLEHFGLSLSIKRHMKEFQEHSGIDCNIELRAGRFTLDQERSTGLFRILQGLLSNVMRHARATKVEVSLKHNSGVLALSVKDNGRGFKTGKEPALGAFGIESIRQRMRYWNGHLEIETAPGQGCAVTVSMPVQDAGIRS